MSPVGDNEQESAELRRMVKDAVSEGVSEAIQRTVTDPVFWQDVREAMLTQTRHAAGSWLIDGIVTGMKFLAWGALVGLALYMVGGWKLIVAVATTFGAHPSNGSGQ